MWMKDLVAPPKAHCNTQSELLYFPASFIHKDYCICIPTPAFWVGNVLIHLYLYTLKLSILFGLFVSLLNSIPLKMILLKS